MEKGRMAQQTGQMLISSYLFLSYRFYKGVRGGRRWVMENGDLFQGQNAQAEP